MAKSKVYTIDGESLTICAPHIDTTFYIGEDDRTEEDRRETSACVDYATTEEGFISYNLDNNSFAKQIALLESGKDRYGHSMAPVMSFEYDGRPYIQFMRAYIFTVSPDSLDDWWDREARKSVDSGESRILTEQGKADLLAAYKAEQERYIKRLRSYLKRYGTSKLYATTFWTQA